MPKTPECDRCLFYAHDYHIVCPIHPSGIDGDSCIDFRPNPELEGKRFVDFLGLGAQQRNFDAPYSNPHDLDADGGLWEPEFACYYNGELILQPSRQRTREEQLWLLDNHPLFTSVCPQCKYRFPQANCHIIHFDCPHCGWVDDSV